MAVRETSRFKINPEALKSDLSLTEERGWHKMDVRWLVTNKTVGSTMSVVGLTKMPPGVKSKHAMHRHPNAEEWAELLGQPFEMLFPERSRADDIYTRTRPNSCWNDRGGHNQH